MTTPATLGATQPWSRVVWPHERETRSGIPGGIGGPLVWDATSALRIPAVGRAEALITGLIRQCPLDAYRGLDLLPRPRLLERPDPTFARAWWVGLEVEDYLRHGNALAMVTSRNAEGWPASVTWLPAARSTISPWAPPAPLRYWFDGHELPADEIVHVRRSASRWNPHVGIGVIEQFLSTFDRVAMEEDYERNSLAGAGVPSIAVETPNPNLSQDEADGAKAKWMDKFYGPIREPVFLPAGTKVIPLGWSPSDSQMVEARKMSLQDVANAFNFDGYWVGAEMKGLTYRSPGPMFDSLRKVTLEPIMGDFEETWADAWLPRGQLVRFDRIAMTREDFTSAVPVLVQASGGPFITTSEARKYLALSAAPGAGPDLISPVASDAPPAAPEEPVDEEPDEETP